MIILAVILSMLSAYHEPADEVVKVKFELEKTRVCIQEPVLWRLSVINNSDTGVEVDISGSNDGLGRDFRFKFFLIDENQDTVHMPESTSGYMWGSGRRIMCPTKKDSPFVFEKFLTYWLPIDEAGVYDVHMSARLHVFIDGESKRLEFNAIEPVKLVVERCSEESIGEVILGSLEKVESVDTSGRTIGDEGRVIINKEVQRLSLIKHELAGPPLGKLLYYPSDYAIMYASRGLRKNHGEFGRKKIMSAKKWYDQHCVRYLVQRESSRSMTVTNYTEKCLGSRWIDSAIYHYEINDE